MHLKKTLPPKERASYNHWIKKVLCGTLHHHPLLSLPHENKIRPSVVVVEYRVNLQWYKSDLQRSGRPPWKFPNDNDVTRTRRFMTLSSHFQLYCYRLQMHGHIIMEWVMFLINFHTNLSMVCTFWVFFNFLEGGKPPPAKGWVSLGLEDSDFRLLTLSRVKIYLVNW